MILPLVGPVSCSDAVSLVVGVRNAPFSVAETLTLDVAPTCGRGSVTALGSLAIEGLG